MILLDAILLQSIFKQVEFYNNKYIVKPAKTYDVLYDAEDFVILHSVYRLYSVYGYFESMLNITLLSAGIFSRGGVTELRTALSKKGIAGYKETRAL